MSNAEYREFVEDGGYERPELWLERGWATVFRKHGWTASALLAATRRRRLDGSSRWPAERELCEDEPVCHLSFIEADAFARWAGARLPSGGRVGDGLRRTGRWRAISSTAAGRTPAPAASGPRKGGLRQAFGDVCGVDPEQPTRPYPGYRPRGRNPG